MDETGEPADENALIVDALEGFPLTTPGIRWSGGRDVHISVILPGFNVEPFIGRCITSLRTHLLEGLGFILVDDCSTDGFLDAVESWAAEDERVRILRNEGNQGLGRRATAGSRLRVAPTSRSSTFTVAHLKSLA